MKLKVASTVALLAFVAVSVIFIVLKERGHVTPAGGREGQIAGASGSTDEGAGTMGTPRNGVIAYYFHTTRRCPTCRKLESYTQEAISAGFADDLEKGRIVWRTVNTDAPDNEHFVRDYGLTTKSVVLVAMDDGKEVRWKNLARIWDLVGDKPAFINYVQGEVRDFQAGR